MTLEIWLIIALGFSFVLNVFFVWFSIKQSLILSYISENINDLLELLSNYRNHLKKVYEMEMFYGDETLKFLLDHTRSLIVIIEEEYGEILDLTSPPELLEEISIEEEERASETEKDVFYGGTRKSDT
mgnify:CR=1 FL=1